MHLMLDLLYKRNLLITTVLDGSIFRTLEEILILPWYYNDEIIIRIKHIFILMKSFFSITLR